jgi:hypothetical protein
VPDAPPFCFNKTGGIPLTAMLGLMHVLEAHSSGLVPRWTRMQQTLVSLEMVEMRVAVVEARCSTRRCSCIRYLLSIRVFDHSRRRGGRGGGGC